MPWQQQFWIYQRDPNFAEKAERALDLDARILRASVCRPDDYVISADEKSRLQALGRRHQTPPAPGRADRAAMSLSMSAAARSRVSRRGMSITPTC